MIIGIMIVIGLLFLFFGAEGLVRGSSALALKIGLSPLVVGLTVVAFGTSAPELVVSANSALQGQGDLALGNVFGSNLFNAAVILGVAALITPLRVHKQVIKFDLPIMIISIIMMFIFLKDRQISRLEGIILTCGIVLYLSASVYIAKREKLNVTVDQKGSKNIFIDLLKVVIGVLFLVVGSTYLVKGAVALARLLHISEAIIGLTIVSTGTSLPELATSIVAGAKKEADIAVGNIIGSNIFNVLSILGISSIIQPIYAQGIMWNELIFSVVPIGVMAVFLVTQRTVVRWEGAILLGLYGVYLVTIWPT